MCIIIFSHEEINILSLFCFYFIVDHYWERDMEFWYCVSTKGVGGNLRLTKTSPSAHNRAAGSKGYIFLHWISIDGNHTIVLSFHPKESWKIYLARRSGSTKMKISVPIQQDSATENEENIVGSVNAKKEECHVFDFHSLSEREMVAQLIKNHGCDGSDLDTTLTTVQQQTGSDATDPAKTKFSNVSASTFQEKIGMSSKPVSSSLSYNVIEASKGTTEFLTYITPQFVRDVFGQFPSVLLAYSETVLKGEMEEETFWREFCCSHYFSSLARGNVSDRLAIVSSTDSRAHKGFFEVYEERIKTENNKTLKGLPFLSTSSQNTTTDAFACDPTLHLDRQNVEIVPSPGYSTHRNANERNLIPHSLEEVEPIFDLSQAVLSSSRPQSSSHVHDTSLNSELRRHTELNDLHKRAVDSNLSSDSHPSQCNIIVQDFAVAKKKIENYALETDSFINAVPFRNLIQKQYTDITWTCPPEFLSIIISRSSSHFPFGQRIYDTMCSLYCGKTLDRCMSSENNENYKTSCSFQELSFLRHSEFIQRIIRSCTLAWSLHADSVEVLRPLMSDLRRLRNELDELISKFDDSSVKREQCEGILRLLQNAATHLEMLIK